MFVEEEAMALHNHLDDHRLIFISQPDLVERSAKSYGIGRLLDQRRFFFSDIESASCRFLEKVEDSAGSWVFPSGLLRLGNEYESF
jgi:hypothetical protein